MIKLTAKEEEVMEKIWQIGNCAPKDVLALYEEPKPHINTIATYQHHRHHVSDVGKEGLLDP